MATLLVSCESENFTIKGDFTDSGTQNVRVAYATNEGIVTEWVTMNNNKFTFTGNSEDITVIYIFNHQKKMIAHVVAKNGDKIELKGNIDEPYRLQVSGNDASEQWYKFINENHEIFENEDSEEKDKAIENYISENPDNIVSALLFINDYSNLSDNNKNKKLLTLISSEARPESIMKNYYAIQSMQNDAASKEKVQSMMLYSEKDTIVSYSPFRQSYNIIYFWNPDDKSRREDVKKLKDYTENFSSKRLLVLDVNLDNDTIKWKNIIRGDSVKNWTRYWAVGGIVNTSLRRLKITSTPYYIVSDSNGVKVYSGKSFNDAINTINTKLKIKK